MSCVCRVVAVPGLWSVSSVTPASAPIRRCFAKIPRGTERIPIIDMSEVHNHHDRQRKTCMELARHCLLHGQFLICRHTGNSKCTDRTSQSLYCSLHGEYANLQALTISIAGLLSRAYEYHQAYTIHNEGTRVFSCSLVDTCSNYAIYSFQPYYNHTDAKTIQHVQLQALQPCRPVFQTDKCAGCKTIEKKERDFAVG